METNFLAIVNETGDRLHVPDKAAMQTALKSFASQEVLVSVEPYDPASKGLRGYYFKVVVGEFRRYLNEQRARENPDLLPLSKDQVHEMMTQAFLGIEQVDFGGGKSTSTGKSTKGIDHVKLWDYIEECCSHAAMEWNLEIPLPESKR